jgi:hypothetical protein
VNRKPDGAIHIVSRGASAYVRKFRYSDSVRANRQLEGITKIKFSLVSVCSRSSSQPEESFRLAKA